MTYIRRIFEAAVLLLAFLPAIATSSSPGTQGAESCDLKGYVELNVIMGDRPLVEVTIAGHKGYMAFSTSSFVSSTYEDVAQSLGLQSVPSGLRLQASNSDKVIDHAFSLKDLTLGTQPIRNATAMPFPRPLNPIGGVPADQMLGELGMDVLSTMDFELDLGHRKIRLFRHTRCKDGPVYWAKEFAALPIKRDRVGVLYFPMELNQRKVATAIAATYKTTTLGSDFSKVIFGFDEHSPDLEQVPGANGEPVAMYTAMKVSAPGLSLMNARVHLAKFPCKTNPRGQGGVAEYYGCHGVKPLVLGLDVLSQLRIFVALQQNMIYFTSADAN